MDTGYCILVLQSDKSVPNYSVCHLCVLPLSKHVLFQPRKNKKKDVNGVVNDSVFAEEFVFTEGLEDGPFQWGIDEAIKMAADKQVLRSIIIPRPRIVSGRDTVVIVLFS